MLPRGGRQHLRQLPLRGTRRRNGRRRRGPVHLILRVLRRFIQLDRGHRRGPRQVHVPRDAGDVGVLVHLPARTRRGRRFRPMGSCRDMYEPLWLILSDQIGRK